LKLGYARNVKHYLQNLYLSFHIFNLSVGRFKSVKIAVNHHSVISVGVSKVIGVGKVFGGPHDIDQ